MHACSVWFGLLFVFLLVSCFFIQAWQPPCTPNNNKMGSRDRESPKTPRAARQRARPLRNPVSNTKMLQEHLRSSDLYKHVLTCTCIHMCIHMCTHSHVHTLTGAHSHICMHSHVHTLTYTHIPESPGLVGPNGPRSCDSQDQSSLCYSACCRPASSPIHLKKPCPLDLPEP